MAQSFAVFVAISILLGRVYHLTYLETLGIPSSEVRLNVVDYSVLSPDVTILGVGIAIVSAVFWWGLKFITSLTDLSWIRILIGIALLILSFPIGRIISDAMVRTEELQAFNSGGFRLILLIPLAMSAAGGLFVASGLPVPGSASNSSNDAAATFNIVGTFIPLFLTSVGLILVLIALSYSVTIGRLDARNTLLDAPQANIDFTSLSMRNGFRYAPEKCQIDSASCDFKVILIGDRFIYLSPVDSEASPENQHIYAFPIEGIETIVYVSEGNPP